MFMWMRDLPYLLYYILAPMASMHENGNVCSWHRRKKIRINPNLTCEKQANKQACETEAQNHEYMGKGFKIEALHVK